MDIVAMVVSIVIGLVAGATAGRIMPGPDPLGPFGTAGLGAAGALAGYATAASLALASPGDSFVPAICMAAIGALAVLVSYRSYAMRAAE